MTRKIELLVHAGAASSRKDDDRNRAQVEAYLGFHGKATHVLSELRREVLDDQSAERDGISALLDQQTSVIEHDRTTFLDDTQMAYTALDSQLFTSSLVIPPVASSGSSPKQSHRLSEAQKGTDGDSDFNVNIESSSVHPAGQHNSSQTRKLNYKARSARDSSQINGQPVLSQSSYLKSPTLDRSAKKQKVGGELSTRHKYGPADLPSYVSLPENNGVGLAYVGGQPLGSTEGAGHSHAQSQVSMAGAQSNSELPTSYSLSDITSESLRAKQDVSQRSASDPGPRLASISPTALREGPTPKKYDESRQPPASNGPAAQPTASRTVRDCSTARAQDTAVNSPKPEHYNRHTDQPEVQARDYAPEQCLPMSDGSMGVLKTLSMSIMPAPPDIALDNYTTNVTPALRQLVNNSDIAHSYKPVSITRELRPLERGHWVVDCSSWKLELQIHFWRFLENTIESGRMGWGVWCTREVNESESGVNGEQPSLGTVQVFCWGEIVRHIYLLLYVASSGKARAQGLHWADAAGETVVQMRSI